MNVTVQVMNVCVPQIYDVETVIAPHSAAIEFHRVKGTQEDN